MPTKHQSVDPTQESATSRTRMHNGYRLLLWLAGSIVAIMVIVAILYLVNAQR